MVRKVKDSALGKDYFRLSNKRGSKDEVRKRNRRELWATPEERDGQQHTWSTALRPQRGSPSCLLADFRYAHP